MRTFFAAAALLLAAASAAAADTRLYADSTLVVQDRFSDEIVGQGPDIVFLPGLSSSRAVWKVSADRLRAHYRVHLIQVAGFAGEPARANAAGPVLVPTAEAIDAYLVAQHLTPATLIGHSMGGTMALYLAETHPGHYAKVMLVDALPFYGVLVAGPGATAEALKPMADNIRNAPAPMRLNDQMAAMMATTPADRATIIGWGDISEASTVKNAMADDFVLDLRAKLAAVTAKTTLVFPDYRPVGRSGIQALYAGQYSPLPGITLVPIENAVHFVMFDQPAAFQTALDAFLR
jgi:pimeloyl-[acyl-carrier protein] methyl ester esterase